VDSRRDSKEVRVCLVSIGSGKVVGVACEDSLFNNKATALEVVGVAQRTVKHWRIESVGNVVKRRLWSVGEGGGELVFQCFLIWKVERSEEGSFVGVVTNHYTDVLVESALSQELSWLQRSEETIHHRPISKPAIRRIIGDLLGVRTNYIFRWKSPQFRKGGSVGKLEILLVNIFLRNNRSNRLPSRTLGNSLLERS
jgi:hypothetical protein